MHLLISLVVLGCSLVAFRPHRNELVPNWTVAGVIAIALAFLVF
jgi:hypothetical protein